MIYVVIFNARHCTSKRSIIHPSVCLCVWLSCTNIMLSEFFTTCYPVIFKIFVTNGIKPDRQTRRFVMFCLWQLMVNRRQVYGMDGDTAATALVWNLNYTQYTPPTPTRLNCRVELCRRCVHTRRLSWPSLQFCSLYVTGAENWKLGHDWRLVRSQRRHDATRLRCPQKPSIEG